MRLFQILTKIFGNWGFWIALVTFTLVTLPHYHDALHYPDVIEHIFNSINLNRHVFERMLFLVPVSLMALSFGLYGGLTASLLALVAMLPRAILLSASPADAVLESGMVFAIGITLSYSYAMLRRERNLRQDLQIAEQNLRLFLQRLTTAQEDERLRISREIHDDTIQSMVVLTRGLDALSSGQHNFTPEIKERLDDLWQQGDSVIRGLRRLSQNLRPPALNRLGLMAALEWLASDVTSRGNFEVKTELTGAEQRLPKDVELALFRIAQEALNNVVKHAEAQNVGISIRFNPGAVDLSVRDDGHGFEPPSRGHELTHLGKLGLIGMQERASLVGGILKVYSKIGIGTTVSVTVPLNNTPDQPIAN